MASSDKKTQISSLFSSAKGDGHASYSKTETTAQITNLPCQVLKNSWENLHFDPDIKPQLLRYVESMSMVTSLIPRQH